MDKLRTIFEYLMDLMGNLVTTFIMLAVLAVMWGIVRYLFTYSPEKKKEGNRFIVYGLLSLLVMTSFLGFLHLFGSVFGIKIGELQNGNFNENLSGEYQPGDSLDFTLQPGVDSPQSDDIFSQPETGPFSNIIDYGVEIDPKGE